MLTCFFARRIVNKRVYYSTANAVTSANSPASINCSIDNKLFIYTTSCTNPYINLSFEELLLKNFNNETKALFVWKNEPTIVLGRNQNPWKEINLKHAIYSNTHITRRASGGGCVYHDLGNVNFTFYTKNFKPMINLEIIQRALLEVGISVEITKRHELLFDSKKITGSAFRITGHDRSCYHHCTLLVNSNLKYLNHILKSVIEIQTKATESVRSTVTNLFDHKPHFTTEKAIDLVINEFKKHYSDSSITKIHYTQEDLLEIPEIQKRTNEHMSWDWIFGNSPPFSVKIQRRFEWGNISIETKIEDGIIKEVEMEANDTNVSDLLAEEVKQWLQELLQNCRFRVEDINQRRQQRIQHEQSTSDTRNMLIDWYLQNV